MNGNGAPTILVYCALHCEAKPLIQRYGLKRVQEAHPFAMYANERVVLVESGVGKVAMAAAVAYAIAVFRPCQPLLLNLGIAGHLDLAVGTVRLVDKAVDADIDSKCFYPQLIGRFPCSSGPLRTLNRPDFNYSGDWMSDMEGSAFFETAVKFGSLELIQCVKIISDNYREPAAAINARRVEEWVEEGIDTIDAIIGRLEKIRSRMVDEEPLLYAELIRRHHFSVSNRLKLKQLLKRWDVVSGGAPLKIDEEFNGAKPMLKWLEDQVERLDFYL